MEFLTDPKFQAALATVILALVGALAAYVSRAVVALLRAKAKDEQVHTLTTIARIAVQAAEQGELAGFVKDKKASAINLVNAYLAQAGITGVTAEQIDAAIEAAIYVSIDQPEDPAIPQP